MLYDIAFLIFSIVYLPILIFKGKLHGDFAERFAVFDKAKKDILRSGKGRIWIQAVSVGEVALCKSLVPELKRIFPSSDIVISTITKAGNDLAKKIFPKDAVIIYFPLDFTFVVRKAIDMIRPKLFIMIETEIWPNLLKGLSARSVPSVLINGRISDRSIDKYTIVKPFLKNVLDKISAYCMQDDIDAERIKYLGAPADRVRVTGNMKFDTVVSNVRPAEAVRGSLGLKEGEDLLVAGSTHRGEDEIIVEAFKELCANFPNLRLLIAPRHLDRVSEIEKIIQKHGFMPVRVSLNTQYPIPNTQILILDTIGHLNEAYSVAALVFIGGSLVKHGGQNPIEPAVFARATLFGPYMFNFKYIAGVFLRREASLEVGGKEELTDKCSKLLNDPEARRRLGDNAKKVISENRGATNRNIEVITRILR
ncbi:MAG: 3-deoxy-D-manno-octulosonic acid transferase [Candidatus Omnitrophica bacterium]|nr:3-deoxy-D-manno-octulosonic acid transferase [Candidatus Omnitrophota bacterium]